MKPDGHLLVKQPGENSTSMIREEQKGLHLLQELVSRLSLPGDIVFNLFGGILSLAVAFLTPLRKFIVNESDKECFEIALCNLKEVLSGVLLAAKHQNTLFGPYPPTAEHIEEASPLFAHGSYETTRITTTTTANLSK